MLLKKQYLFFSILILYYLINGICSINTLSITSDEGAHLSYGIRMLKGEPARTNPELDNSKMPISAINAFPRAAEQIFSRTLKRNDNGLHDTVNGRYITLFFSVLIILLVFDWSRRLYGANAGLFSTFLFVFCPNNIANAVLVTTDTYCVFFLLATIYFLWRYCNSKEIKDFTFFAVFLSLSQLSKQSLLHLYILSPLCMIAHAIVIKEKVKLLLILKQLFIVILCSWLIINAGYIFYGMNIPLGNYHFRSDLFLHIQHFLPANIPVPFSRSFIEGLDLAKYYDNLGGGLPLSSMGNVTILGQSAIGGAFWYYYFVSIFFKTPITYMIIAGWAFYILTKTTGFKSFIKNEFFLLAPVFYFLVLLSFFYKSQAGIRHIIFIYPLLFIFSGITIKYFKAKTELPAIVLLSLFLIFSVTKYFNNYYPYTNEFIGHKENAYQYVGAGNLNIGQAGYLLQHYLQKHPEVKMAPLEPMPGKFVLAVDRFLDVWNTGKYGWLHKYKPVGEVAYSYLLFDTGN